MLSDGTIRWGLLGTARINAKLLAGAALADRVHVAAVGSRQLATARQFAADNGIPRAHGSYAELLADPQVDAVYISIPNSAHHEWTMQALAAGKHVLCEKPYTRRPDEVNEAFDAAEAGGLILEEGFMWRHSPQTRRLMELLPTLGEALFLRASFSHRLGDRSDIRLAAALDGGSLMDVGCYCVSAARLVAGGEPEVVFAQQVLDESGVDRRFAGLLRFAGGFTATIHSGFDSEHEPLEVVGRQGSVMLPDPWHARSGVLVVNGEEERVEPLNPYRMELEDVGAATRGERAPLLGRADALGQARAIEALYRSADTGQPVSLTAPRP
jgi:D-xylose 1-dehydrogenase (NADP+, D-xylono-1,5-lactone-forming)